MWSGRRLLSAIFLLVLLAGTAEASKPCPQYQYALPDMDVVVSGRVRTWPIPGAAVIEVSQYYKGSGPRIVVVDTKSLGSFGLWRAYRKRSVRGPEYDWVFSFHQGWGNQWYRSGCDPWTSMDTATMPEAIAALGPGRPPEPGVGLHSNTAIAAIVAGPVITVVLLVWLWRRRKSRT